MALNAYSHAIIRVNFPFKMILGINTHLPPLIQIRALKRLIVSFSFRISLYDFEIL